MRNIPSRMLAFSQNKDNARSVSGGSIFTSFLIKAKLSLLLTNHQGYCVSLFIRYIRMK